MNLDLQIEHAKALLQSGKRVEELIAKRETLQTELEAVNAELAELIGGGAPANSSGRAPQKCSVCGETGHSKRTCPKPKE